jgi:hypothetical protein
VARCALAEPREGIGYPSYEGGIVVPPLLYKCSSTGMNLQAWFEIEDDAEDHAYGLYETVIWSWLAVASATNSG